MCGDELVGAALRGDCSGWGAVGVRLLAARHLGEFVQTHSKREAVGLDPVAEHDAAFDLRYVPQRENTGEGEREVGEDDLATAFYREGMIDLIEMLREQFVLALPMKPLCGEDCRGLCPVCGVNLNDDPDHAHEPEPDPRWAKLSEIKFE